PGGTDGFLLETVEPLHARVLPAKNCLFAMGQSLEILVKVSGRRTNCYCSYANYQGRVVNGETILADEIRTGFILVGRPRPRWGDCVGRRSQSSREEQPAGDEER